MATACKQKMAGNDELRTELRVRSFINFRQAQA
jgi:hypothetical protein